MGEHLCQQKQRLAWCSYEPRNAEERKLPEARKLGKQGRRLHSVRGSMALLTPWFQTSSLQNSKQINFCCFKIPACGSWLCSPRKLTHHVFPELVWAGPARAAVQSSYSVSEGCPMQPVNLSFLEHFLLLITEARVQGPAWGSRSHHPLEQSLVQCLPLGSHLTW